jgi:UPF0755 protein
MKKKTVILIPFLVGLVGLVLWPTVFSPVKTSSTEKEIFSVQKGDNVFAIGRNLEKEKLIKSQWFFDLAVFLQLGSSRLKTGSYYLSPIMSPWEIAGKIIQGDIAKETITIPEGWNAREIDELLKNKNLIAGGEFLQVVDNPPAELVNQFSFLSDKPKTLGLEGYLFPDTYEIKVGENAKAIVQRLLENFDAKLTSELKTEIQKQEKTIFEIITMASILEKEVKTRKDKELVADILWKRLKIGMPLQVDASAKYGPLYDTYKFSGLPPGPIANPGLESILAAIYPEKSDYWYYLSGSDGKTYFSKTLEEHSAKKAEYLKL